MKQELLNKTRICRHWQVGMEREPYLTADECMQKYCPHKDRCFFAHGEHELRVLPARGQGLASSGMMPGQPQGGAVDVGATSDGDAAGDCMFMPQAVQQGQSMADLLDCGSQPAGGRSAGCFKGDPTASRRTSR